MVQLPHPEARQLSEFVFVVQGASRSEDTHGMFVDHDRSEYQFHCSFWRLLKATIVMAFAQTGQLFHCVACGCFCVSCDTIVHVVPIHVHDRSEYICAGGRAGGCAMDDDFS